MSPEYINNHLHIAGETRSARYVVTGGTAAQFLKADGSLDGSSYLTAAALGGYATTAWVGANFLPSAYAKTNFASARLAVVPGVGVSNAPTLGSPAICSLFLAGDNGLWGSYFGHNSSTGSLWIQVQRNDGRTEAYEMDLNPKGGAVRVNGSNVWHSGNLDPSTYIPKSHPAYNITQAQINDGLSYKGYSDNRVIQPAQLPVRKLQFGFASFGNNGTGPWADYLHFGGYQDSSGGSQNLIVFNRNGFGMRQFQGSWQGVTPYSSYVDYWHTGDFTQESIDKWCEAYDWGNHAEAGYATAALLNGVYVRQDDPRIFEPEYAELNQTESYHYAQPVRNHNKKIVLDGYPAGRNGVFAVTLPSPDVDTEGMRVDIYHAPNDSALYPLQVYVSDRQGNTVKTLFDGQLSGYKLELVAMKDRWLVKKIKTE